MKKEKGFTLIELLVTVAIIGVLSSIAIPAFKDHKIRVYNTVNQQLFRETIVAVEALIATTEDFDTHSSLTCLQSPGAVEGTCDINGIVDTPIKTLEEQLLATMDAHKDLSIDFLYSEGTYSFNIYHCKGSIQYHASQLVGERREMGEEDFGSGPGSSGYDFWCT